MVGVERTYLSPEGFAREKSACNVFKRGVETRL